jgi:hypothetical protein
VLVMVRDNRVTFEAWDQMGAGENEGHITHAHSHQ